MAHYPDPNQPQPTNPGQQPWPSGAPPAQGGSLWPAGSQPQNLFSNATPPSIPSGSPGSPAVFSPAWQPVQQPVRNSRPLVLALLAFPFLSLKMFVWPGPATFSKEKDRVGGGTVFFLLLVGGAVTGALAYLWGRVSRLTPGIENLSAGRVVAQPLSVGMCAVLAVGVPVLFLLLESVLYWVAKKQGGKPGSLRAQLYTGLLIEAPLYVLVVALALVLLSRPDLGNSARLLFAVVAGVFLLYSLLLHIFAVMAVHRVGVGKAMLCVALIVVALAAVVVALLASGENEGSRSGSSSHASSSDQQIVGPGDGSAGGDWGASYQQGFFGRSDRRAGGKAPLLVCPTCAQWLPEGIGQPGMSCPRCGTPMR